MSDNLPALYAELERIGAEAAHWAEVEASSSTALVHVGSADPEKVREQMIEVRREARQKSKDLQKAADKVRAEVEAEMNRVRGEMQERMSAAMAALAPLREQVKRMEEGIWTVNLYLGTSEQIATLREGKPAHRDTPITLRTAVLAMDEEMAAFPVINGEEDQQGLDYRNLDLFDQWLMQPEALRQVLPEERGIVVLRPRRTEYHYDDDPLVNDERNAPNRVSHWLIRNGENLYRMTTDFRVGDNLMPTSAEFTRLFTRREFDWSTRTEKVVEILPGTEEWEKAEKAQGAVQRHYMRVALILQGLLDRTEVFEPLPGAINVMQQSAYDSGLVVVVNDVENTLTTGREPYYDWIRRMNADLRPGMRVIGTFRGSEWAEDDYDRSRGNARLSPSGAERPPSHVLHIIEDRRDFRGEKGLVIRYKRTEEVYDPDLWVPSPTRPGWGHRGGYRVPERRASAVILPSDVTVIPFDLVTEEEMQTYLDARTERHAYKDSFPLLNAAIRAKREEREAEAPFRDLLVKVLAEDNGQDVEDVLPHINGLVHRFKLGNRWHRPLVSMTQEEEAKALRLIRAEYGRIVRSGADGDRDAHAVQVLREHDPEVMFVGRLSSGKYVAFAPHSREYREGAAHPSLWVREHTTTKTARTVTTREWITPGVRGNKMTVLFEDERWTGWDRLSDAKDDLTDPEVAEVLERVRSRAVRLLSDDGDDLLAIEHDRAKRTWIAWGTDRDKNRTRWRRQDSAGATKVTFEWTRGSDGIVVLREPRVTGEEFELSYGGNTLLGDGVPANTRSVYMPWHTGSRARFTQTEGEQGARNTVVWEVDEEARAAVVDWVRSVEARLDEDRLVGRRVYSTLRDVNDAQEREQVERIRAEFLAEYPDEEMWEEHRSAKTKGVRAQVDVTSDHGHYERYDVRHHEGGGSSASLRPPTSGAVGLGECLRVLYRAGHSWAGITIEGAYALAGGPMPEVYEPIKHIVLREADV